MEQSEKVSEELQVGSLLYGGAKKVFGHKQRVMHCKTFPEEIVRGWDGWHGEERGEASLREEYLQPSNNSH